jgi:hypothetical protein
VGNGETNYANTEYRSGGGAVAGVWSAGAGAVRRTTAGGVARTSGLGWCWCLFLCPLVFVFGASFYVFILFYVFMFCKPC